MMGMGDDSLDSFETIQQENSTQSLPNRSNPNPEHPTNKKVAILPKDSDSLSGVSSANLEMIFNPVRSIERLWLIGRSGWVPRKEEFGPPLPEPEGNRNGGHQPTNSGQSAEIYVNYRAAK
jgi:hypothetical protein